MGTLRVPLHFRWHLRWWSGQIVFIYVKGVGVSGQGSRLGLWVCRMMRTCNRHFNPCAARCGKETTEQDKSQNSGHVPPLIEGLHLL